MKIDFHNIGTVEDKRLEFAVIVAMHKGRAVFVRHKERDTWEIPGGHREKGETIEAAGHRELEEETGAKDYVLKTICEYSVTREASQSYGRLFVADIKTLGQLPETEIAEVRLFDELPEHLTYPAIQPLLYKKALDFLLEIK